MVEIVGCAPQLIAVISKDVIWIRDQLNSTREDVREYAAVLYSLILNATQDSFESAINYLIKQTDNKNLESQHGAILALGNCLEFNENKQGLVKTVINHLVTFLKHSNALLVGSACASIGLLARRKSLPLVDGKIKDIGSPDAKKPAIESISKIDIVERLMDVMNNTKLSAKTREKAARALGLLCVGEKFPHAQKILEGFLSTAKETKDVEVHFTIGEALVMCCQSIWSPEARNAWTTPLSNQPIECDDAQLELLLEELLKLAKTTHPNSKQASCIWLLAILKGCGERKPITERLQRIQDTFMDLLCENSGEYFMIYICQTKLRVFMFRYCTGCCI